MFQHVHSLMVSLPDMTRDDDTVVLEGTAVCYTMPLPRAGDAGSGA